MSLLAKGPLETLEKIALALTEFRIPHWLISPSQPAFAPQRIRSITRTPGEITFTTQKDMVSFPKGARVLAIFADMSGELAIKSVKHLLTSHAYRGRDNIEHIQDDKIFQTILQGSPVLDLYRLDGDDSIIQGVRVFPGKFDPKGLGDKATLSSRQNLKAILDLITRDYASTLTLRTDFGMVNLPGCSLNRDNLEDPETLRRNLISLTRYGWLMADIIQAGKKPETEPEISDLAAITTPLMGATGLTPDTPLIQEVEQTLAKELADENDKQKPPKTSSSPALPAPPEGPGRLGVEYPGILVQFEW